MASPRTRRLKIDYELLSRRFANWPVIQISASAGLPRNTTASFTHSRDCMWTRREKYWSETGTCSR